MELRVIGAGLGRTGTSSLQAALAQLLGAPCYHMAEVFGRSDHTTAWAAAARGERVDWDALLSGYAATVDWPAAAFWPELTAAHPDAVVLLSTRSSAAAWWASADATIFAGLRKPPDRTEGPGVEWRAMWDDLVRHRFTDRTDDAERCMALYEEHNARVRDEVDPARLVEWQPGDGWAPLCSALDVAVPDVDFPHLNSTDDFLRRERSEPT